MMHYVYALYSAEIGVGLTGFGIVFIFLGVMLFFDRGLLAMGNVSYTAHVIQYHHPIVYRYYLLPGYVSSLAWLGHTLSSSRATS